MSKELRSANDKVQMERPILFSTPMVQAILEGRKTMTRRMIKTDFDFDECIGSIAYFNSGITQLKIKCPYGQPGDLLWVRETFTPFKDTYCYKASPETYSLEFDGSTWSVPKIYKPSIFMPKAAARIWLQITDIKVERLGDISEEEAKKEGIYDKLGEVSGRTFYRKFIKEKEARIQGLFTESAKECFQTLWTSINGQKSWDENPWVWGISFKVLSTTGRPELRKEATHAA